MYANTSDFCEGFDVKYLESLLSADLKFDGTRNEAYPILMELSREIEVVVTLPFNALAL